MNEMDEQFRVVLRGYDPAQVKRAIGQLNQSLQASDHKIHELTERVRELSAEGAADGRANASFAGLGERVAQILSLAEDEAAELRAVASGETETMREQAEKTAAGVGAEADRYAEQRRSAADADAAEVYEHARRRADDLLDGAERDAAARLQEAEAVYENQRAKAAQAASDFETTLAKRRERSEHEFTQRSRGAQEELAEVEARVEHTRSEAEKMRSEAELQARRVVEDAQQQAATIVAEGRTHADRIRAESERELSAATQRRDSINAQLTNVRQMLATLTGAAPSALVEQALNDAGSEPTEGATEEATGSGTHETDPDEGQGR